MRLPFSIGVVTFAVLAQCSHAIAQYPSPYAVPIAYFNRPAAPPVVLVPVAQPVPVYTPSYFQGDYGPAVGVPTQFMERPRRAPRQDLTHQAPLLPGMAVQAIPDPAGATAAPRSAVRLPFLPQ